MGRPKLLLPWAASSALGHILAVWNSLGAVTVAVVCAPAPHPVLQELDRLAVPADCRILNSQPEHGMFSSIQCAAQWSHWSPELTHFALVLGDQPQIATSTLRALIVNAAAHPHRITQPTFRGRPKHPVILPRDAFLSLATTKFTSLRDFLESRSASRNFADFSDESLMIDLDLPEDYRVALERFGSNH